MGLRVLVIEDEASIADFVIRGLRDEGYAVEHAGDGADGWYRMRTGEWDAILLDWWLPARDGLDLLKAYRQRGGEAPILFLTARDAIADRVRGLDAGADDYLCKPFAFEELLARVRTLSRRRNGRHSAQLSFGDICYDLATQRADRAGHRLELTLKEQALLVFLLHHANEVLSRTRIYEHVWDERYDGLSNTLEVHIFELRRKLEAHGPRVIQTIRGRGYMLSDPANGPGVGT